MQPTLTPFPTLMPTSHPTQRPTTQPTQRPTTQPTQRPTQRPSPQPTSRPTLFPTPQPTPQPQGPQSPSISSTEYVALPHSSKLQWIQVSYSNDVTSCEDVQYKDASGNSLLGAWDASGMLSGSNLIFTGRVHDDIFYGFVQKTLKVCAAATGCSDTLRGWFKSGGSFDIDLVSSINAFTNAVAKKASQQTYLALEATHTFEIGFVDGQLVAFCITHEMRNFVGSDAKTYADAIFAIALPINPTVGSVYKSQALVPTTAGAAYFSLYDKLGTLSALTADGIYKLPMSGTGELYHGNGLHFFNSAGLDLMAMTQKTALHVFIANNPWSSAQVNILQRFGSTKFHTFGVSTADQIITGVHNAVSLT
jgi:hypothetical protein